MQYYKRNIGDYAKKAGRLSILQHGAYNLLLDCCYDREQFPTKEQAIEWTWAATPEEVAAVEFVLSRFFCLQPDGTFLQQRVAEEIALYAEFCEKQSAKGKTGGRPKNPGGIVKKPVGLQVEPGGKQAESRREAGESLTTNQEPLTTNQEPQEKKKRVALDYSVWPQQPSEQVMSDWLAMRKRLKADVSQTVINSFGRELQLAVQAGFSVDDCLMECVTSNWRGFKAAWIKGRTPTARHNDFENRNYNAGVTDGTF
jgi:uncharacterized protein YdaU (DUF1376 family)